MNVTDLRNTIPFRNLALLNRQPHQLLQLVIEPRESGLLILKVSQGFRVGGLGQRSQPPHQPDVRTHLSGFDLVG